MTRWFTADLHLGHANIIEYSSRPFDSVDAMNRALIDRWNEVVAADDEVWMLGDFALGKTADTLPLVAELAGRKILLTGNHDRCWPGHGWRADGWEERYLEAGFDEIQHGDGTIDVGEHKPLACHFPYRGDSNDRDRFVDSRPVDRGQWLLHGHVHERWLQRGRMINVGVDAWDYRPVSGAELSQLIASGPADRAPSQPGV
ncbi:MAG: metallophosphoesterase family protein [Acidimicrobiales bacterium]